MTAVQVALYARVSSEQQAEAKTIESHLAEIRTRSAADGYEEAWKSYADPIYILNRNLRRRQEGHMCLRYGSRHTKITANGHALRDSAEVLRDDGDVESPREHEPTNRPMNGV